LKEILQVIEVFTKLILQRKKQKQDGTRCVRVVGGCCGAGAAEALASVHFLSVVVGHDRLRWAYSHGFGVLAQREA